MMMNCTWAVETAAPMCAHHCSAIVHVHKKRGGTEGRFGEKSGSHTGKLDQEEARMGIISHVS